MAANEKQKEALAKARAAKAEKAAQKTINVGEVDNSNKSNKDVWLQGLLTAITVCDIKHESQVKTVIPLADEILRVYKERF